MDVTVEAGPLPLSPAEAATDDVLVLLFTALAEGFCSPDALHMASHKMAASRFTWFRTTLPSVCQRWKRLVLQTPSLWSCCIINPAAEAQATRRSKRQRRDLTGAAAAAGASPMGSSPLRQPRFYEQQDQNMSGMSTPNRGASPVMCSSPDSDSGAYWMSQFAPQTGGASPRHISQRLSRLSTGRHAQRVTLSASAVSDWLATHAAAAAGISTLSLDLSHHMGSHDYTTASLDALLQKLPQLTRVMLAGAVEGTDAYEPLARLRHLGTLELSSASQACLDGGMLALCFLPQLTSLWVSLDIPPAFPMTLNDLPSSLHSLRLGAMWLEEMPQQIADCVGLTKIVLERCQMEQNPLPLLLTLPSLASITIRTASRGSSEASLPVLLPMHKPQQQLLVHPHGAGSRGRGQARPGRMHAGAAAAAAAAAATAAPSSSVDGPGGRCFVNSSVTSLSLVDVGMRQLPPCISQLVSLQELQLALNHDLALNPTHCLPQALTCLTGLQSLGLGNCSLHHLPPVVACLTGLTRLELQGNALSIAGFSNGGLEPRLIGFVQSLRVLDLTAQGSGRARMRGIPAWVGQCGALTELRLGCSCLGYDGDASSSNLSAAVAAVAAAGGAGGSSSRGLHHSSSDLGVRGRQQQHVAHGSSSSSSRPDVRGVGAHGQAAVRHSLDLGHATSAPPAVVASSSAAAAAATANSAAPPAVVGPAGLSLQQLPVLLPQLQLLVIEGGMWEQRAVQDALQLVRLLAKTGSSLQLVLPL